MKPSFSLNAKTLGMALIAAALSFALIQSIFVEPAGAAGCRELAVSIGGCGGPTDESCILSYCAGQAFQDIMEQIREQNRRDMKKKNKEETQENVAEDTIATCDVGGGTNCILFSYFTDFCVFIPEGTPSATLGGVPIPFSIGSTEEFEITVEVPSTQVLEFKCTGDDILGCVFAFVTVAGGSCVPDPSFVQISGEGTDKSL